MKSNNCEQKECCKRHHKRCKWEGNQGGCKRNDECDYLNHGESVKVNDGNVVDDCEYQCAGCKVHGMTKFTW